MLFWSILGNDRGKGRKCSRENWKDKFTERRLRCVWYRDRWGEEER